MTAKELQIELDAAREKIDELNDQIADLLTTARLAADLMPIAFTHHEDAQRFGWTDRDEDAWRIVTDVYCDLVDRIPAPA